MEQNIYTKSQKYNTNNNLKYFLKMQIIYNNPKLFTASLFFTQRPGNFITKVIEGIKYPNYDYYIPIFGKLNDFSLGKYARMDFSINKIFSINKSDSLITFLTINNLLNKGNVSSVYYNSDYSQEYNIYYQKRFVYMGLQYRF